MNSTRTIRTGLRTAIAAAGLVAAFALPAQAIASNDCSNVGSDPTQAQYCSPTQGGGNEGTQASGSQGASAAGAPSPSGTASSSNGLLPFTGLDLAVLLAVAGILAATGFALRRFSASNKG